VKEERKWRFLAVEGADLRTYDRANRREEADVGEAREVLDRVTEAVFRSRATRKR
jgi:hypothetical protein